MLLPQSITVTTPARLVDGYGNQGQLDYPNGTTRTVAAYVQPAGQPGTGGEEFRDRDAVQRSLLAFTADPLDALDRVTFEGKVYEVDGPPRAWDTPRGPHHYESDLRLVEG